MGIRFYGKFFWGYEPSAGELRKKLLQGWVKEKGRSVRTRDPITMQRLVKLLRNLQVICYDMFEFMLFILWMVWLFFGAFRISELLAKGSEPGMKVEHLCLKQRKLSLLLCKSKTDQRGQGSS